MKELHKFFKDPEIDAIICMRGGYGVIRLIKDIDYKLIKNNPKVLYFPVFSEILKRETLLNALVYIALLVVDIFILLHFLCCKIIFVQGIEYKHAKLPNG